MSEIEGVDDFLNCPNSLKLVRETAIQNSLSRLLTVFHKA